MKFVRYKNTQEYKNDVNEILMQSEAENQIPLNFAKREMKDDWLLSSIKDENDNVLLVAACSPPYNIVLYAPNHEASDEVLSFLSDKLNEINFSIPGVMSEKNIAKRFAEIHAKNFQIKISLLAMQAEQLTDTVQVSGLFRPFAQNDLCFAPFWLKEMEAECNLFVRTIQQFYDNMKDCIGEKAWLYFWEDGGVPKSMAGISRTSENGACIGYVYTPPYFRGKGYATACVAALSKKILADCYKFCFLFVDAANPVSMGIYKKLGYKQKAAIDEIVFN